MSKKEKDKRKRGEGGKEPGSAWIADLRPQRSPPPSLRPYEAAGTSATGAHRASSPYEVTDDDDAPSEPGEDPSEETLADIAPVGPTEFAGARASESIAPTAAVPAPPPASIAALQQQIRDLEARLDEMIASPHRPTLGAPPSNPRPTLEPVHDAAVASAAAEVGEPHLPDVRATARDLLPNDFYLRQWGRAGMRKRAEDVDEFGHDPKYEARFLPFFDFLYRTYFRVDAEGTEHIPATGRCLLVSNHSGGPLPYDGIMLRTTVRRELAGAAEPRELRWLAEDFIYHLPFVGTAMNRLGAVRACQENAERLLGRGDLVAVFPEGAKGIGKLFRERYQLQRFGRGGFIRLCLRTRTPIVPAAIVGAEEANPMLYRLEYMAKSLGVPYLPITPTFPALGPLGLLPAPTKWKVVFGEPIHFGAHGPEAADDDLLVGRLADRVRATIQAMLDRTLADRKSIWFG